MRKPKKSKPKYVRRNKNSGDRFGQWEDAGDYTFDPLAAALRESGFKLESDERHRQRDEEE